MHNENIITFKSMIFCPAIVGPEYGIILYQYMNLFMSPSTKLTRVDRGFHYSRPMGEHLGDQPRKIFYEQLPGAPGLFE